MPTPRSGEKQKEFVARFVSSGEAKRDFPKRSQRLAVAFSIFRRRKNK